MKNKVFIIVGICAALAVIAIAALGLSGALDIVGNMSVKSFEKVLAAIPGQVMPDEQNGGWSLVAPDGSARFIWSKDFSASPGYDVMFEFDSAPFVKAGLDLSLMPDGTVQGEKLIVGQKLGDESLTYEEEATPLSSYERIVKLKRSSIKYHGDLDHFGVSLGNGNMFEIAKDMGSNDKDIVFVLNPQAFLDAGVDPVKVDGWVFAKIKVEDANGKMIEVDKFLKPFNLL